MDAYVFVFSLAFSLILLLFAFMGSRAGWGLLGFFGATIAAICTLVLYADGNLTITTAGGIQTLAAANGNFVSDFNLIEVIPLTVCIGECVVTVRRVFHI